MPINFPTLKNLVDRTRSDVSNTLPNSDPTIFGSFLRAITDALSSRAYDIVLLIQQALNQFFPQTSSGIYLERWAGYEGISRNPATQGSGFAVFTGTLSSTIPLGTELNSADGNTYITQSGASITTNTFTPSSIIRVGTTATVTAADHPLATGVSVTISGANETEYNGTFSVTVIDNNTFQYEVTGSPATPATGTLSASSVSAKVAVKSESAGQNQNLDSGASITLSSALSGVDSVAYITHDGVSGATDVETDDELRQRVLSSRANPVSNFNSAAIEKQARTVAGVTRVFVQEITPNVGDVTIYFFRDNDINPIPSSSELLDVKNKIIEILPATSDESNVYVLAPTLVNTNFTFTSISPDTPTMRTAITNNLIAFFEDKAKFETDVTQDQYRSAIIDTQDTATGDFLESFTLSSPAGDISITTGEIAGLGTVTYP